ncbi:ABC transporter ATP-binding protein/permease [Oscillospiraceae bacterium OttesenSCG-928-G22]|nr:ABC transporter ATP-binding protein/permease [Oscillospiraceae bacterium OttesenSCG-928-G22]
MNAIHETDYQEQKIKLGTWRRVLSYATKNRKYIYLALLFGMFTGILDLVSSLVSMVAIDRFITPRLLTGFLPFVFLVIAVQFLFALCTFVFVRASGKLEAHLAADIRKDAFRKLQTLSFSYYDRSSVGYLITRLTTDVSRTIDTVSWSFIDLGWGVMAILASVVGMLIVNVKLALILLAVFPALIFVSYFFQKRILRYQRETRRLNSMITSAFNEGIMGARTTKTLHREELNDREFVGLSGKMRRASLRANMIAALYLPAAMLLVSVGIAVVLTYGGYDVTAGAITVGELNFFITVGGMMLEPIRSFARILAEFQSSQAAAERLVDVLNTEPEITDSDAVIEQYGDVFTHRTEHWEDIRGDVEFKDVSFRYKEGEAVLSHFNLRVRAGETIALVGETGGGKSTIVNLVCRFYEPQSGAVLIDGVDVRERSQSWLQARLGYVLQSPYLFSGTILENVRYGRLGAADEEVFAACRLVGAEEFILELEHGYGTQVGEGGGLLSTGQKQLLSFARAILANPRIFVLDEATSSIDTESEGKIQAASELLLKERTSFVIAHRLSTIRNADRILVIEDGGILEEGTHAELLEKRGYYHSLYTNQFRSEMEEKSLRAFDEEER